MSGLGFSASVSLQQNAFSQPAPPRCSPPVCSPAAWDKRSPVCNSSQFKCWKVSALYLGTFSNTMEMTPLATRQIWNFRVGGGLLCPTSQPQPMRVRSQWDNGPSTPVPVPLRFPRIMDPFDFSSKLWVRTPHPLLAFLPFLSHSSCSLPQLLGFSKKLPAPKFSSKVLVWGNPIKTLSLFNVSGEDTAWLCFLPPALRTAKISPGEKHHNKCSCLLSMYYVPGNVHREKNWDNRSDIRTTKNLFSNGTCISHISVGTNIATSPFLIQRARGRISQTWNYWKSCSRKDVCHRFCGFAMLKGDSSLCNGYS